MLQQRIQAERAEPFPGDDDLNRAVIAVGSRVAEYAALTHRLAVGQFASLAARDEFRAIVVEKRDRIISRARSAGAVEHEMERFWEAAIAQASEVTRKRVEIFPIAPRVALPAPAAPLVPKAKLAKLKKLRNGGRA